MQVESNLFSKPTKIESHPSTTSKPDSSSLVSRLDMKVNPTVTSNPPNFIIKEKPSASINTFTQSTPVFNFGPSVLQGSGVETSEAPVEPEIKPVDWNKPGADISEAFKYWKTTEEVTTKKSPLMAPTVVTSNKLSFTIPSKAIDENVHGDDEINDRLTRTYSAAQTSEFESGNVTIMCEIIVIFCS